MPAPAKTVTCRTLWSGRGPRARRAQKCIPSAPRLRALRCACACARMLGAARRRADPGARAQFLAMFRAELLDLREIMGFLRMGSGADAPPAAGAQLEVPPWAGAPCPRRIAPGLEAQPVPACPCVSSLVAARDCIRCSICGRIPVLFSWCSRRLVSMLPTCTCKKFLASSSCLLAFPGWKRQYGGCMPALTRCKAWPEARL